MTRTKADRLYNALQWARRDLHFLLTESVATDKQIAAKRAQVLRLQRELDAANACVVTQ